MMALNGAILFALLSSYIFAQDVRASSNDTSISQNATLSVSISTSSSHSSFKTSTKSSARVGDFVAQGLGLSSEDSTSLSPVSTSSNSMSSMENGAHGFHSLRGTGDTASLASESTSTIFKTLTREILTNSAGAAIGSTILSAGESNFNGSAPHSSGSSGKNGTKTGKDNFTARNLTYTGDCWNQWNDFWSYSVFNVKHFLRTEETATTTSMDLFAITTVSGVFTYTGWNGVFESTAFIGAFPTSTTTSTFTPYVTTVTENTGLTTASWVTDYDVGTTSFTSTYAGSMPVITPSCELPSIVPECQSAWEAWVADEHPAPMSISCPASRPNCTHDDKFYSELQEYQWYAVTPLSYAELLGPSPICQQASVTGQGCSKLVHYLLTNSGDNRLIEYTSFPSDSVLAPGCTVGCQTCAITGDQVQLYYWPPNTEQATNTRDQPPLITAAPGVVTQVMQHNGTDLILTSPTIYISYHLLYASDSCSGIGPTLRDTIIPLTNSADLSSLIYYPGDQDWAASWSTASFNITDLVPPIPQSIYEQDPRCAALRQEFGRENAISPNATFTCTQTKPYAPIIAVPPEVTNLIQEWKGCTAWYGGLYDPPKALQQAASAAGPTTPDADPTTMPASPSSTVGDGRPAATSIAHPNSPSQPSEPADPAEESNGDPANTIESDPPKGTSAQEDPEDDPSDHTDGATTADVSVMSEDPALATNVVLSIFEEATRTVAPEDAASREDSGMTTPRASHADEAVNSANNGNTANFAAPSANEPNAPDSTDAGTTEHVVTAEGQILTFAQPTAAGKVSAGVVFAGTTLSQGGAAVVTSGLTISIGGDKNRILVNGHTVTIGNDGGQGAQDSAAAQAVFTGSNGQHVTVQQHGNSKIVVADGDSTTTTPVGRAMTFNGHIVSMQSGGGAVVVNGNTIALTTADPAAGSAKSIRGTATLTFAGNTLTASMVTSQSGVVVIDGVTVTSGKGAKTVDGGAMVSYGSDGLLVGGASSTMTVAVAGSSGAAEGQENAASSAVGSSASPGADPETMDDGSDTANDARRRHIPLEVLAAGLTLLFCIW